MAVADQFSNLKKKLYVRCIYAVSISYSGLRTRLIVSSFEVLEGSLVRWLCVLLKNPIHPVIVSGIFSRSYPVHLLFKGVF